MLRITWFVVAFFAGTIMFKQNEYVLEIEHIDVLEFDKRYMSEVTIRNFRLKRTSPRAINFTLAFKINPGNALRLEITSYRFASNEYRAFPMDFSINLCDVIRRNEFGIQNLYACGNFSRCPLEKGNYIICNWSPNYTKYPPQIPGGRYMFDWKFMFQSVQLMRLQAHMAINYIFKN